jgi:hypothetical protein
MKFKDLLKLTEASRAAADSFRTTGEAMRKDREKSKATTDKAKDAARKRAERAKQVPRERKAKAELVKDVIAVKTATGRVQLIFKDSFNKNIHTRINKTEAMTEAEARQYTSDPKFEQTRASKLLFGELKAKEEKKEEGKKKEEPSKKEGGKKEEPEKKEGEQKPKAKKLSNEEIMKAMLQMTPEQLAEMPPEVQKDFFEKLRSPMAAKDFDNISFEALSNKFGINTLSSVPYNQQVLNALLFVAKIKAGASDQEMQTLLTTSAASLDFTKGAFLQASKILSQIGDECIKNLVSSIEAGNSSMYSEGAPELECGDYKFKISAGGEMSISTNNLNQGGKIVKGIIGNSLGKALLNPDNLARDPGVQGFVKNLEQQNDIFATQLLPDQALAELLKNPEMVKQLQSFTLTSPSGKNLGTAIDGEGNVNPAISLTTYQKSINDAGKDLFKQRNSQFLRSIATNVLKSSLRGDDIRDPKTSANHVITVNGVFQLSDDYIDEIAKTAKIDVKKNKEVIDGSNLSTYKSKSAENLSKWRRVIEEKEESNEKIDLKKMFVDRKKIDPMNIFIQNALNNFTFDINASLLPGFKPEEVNAIEYNYVTVDGKTTKIPVVRNEKVASKLLGENYCVINDMLVETLTNNFLLSQLAKMSIVDDSEMYLITKYGSHLLQEEDLRIGCLIPILNKLYERTSEDPEFLIPIFEEILNNISEESERNYKKEYRNYHGKPKQRKERAARTKARELMMKKGLVKKGDGIDIDHKKPLRSGGSNGINNLRKRKKSHNRADNGHRKGEKQNKDWK